MQLHQVTCVTEKCLIQHATSTFACPLCELGVAKLNILFTTTKFFFSRNTKFHENSHIKQPTQSKGKYYIYRHGTYWLQALTFLVSMYKCVYNFHSMLCRNVERRSSQLYSGRSTNRLLNGTPHIPTEFVYGFPHLQHKATRISSELGNDYFLPNVFISVVNIPS
jgi:hypothetical protein